MARRTESQEPNAPKCLLRDVDGCLANFFAEVVRTWGEPQVSSAYSLEEMYPMVSSAEIQHFIYLPTTYIRLRPIVGALNADAQLRGAGWGIVNVTCRPPHVWEETYNWLWDLGFAPRYQNHPALIVSPRGKINLLREEWFDAVVEDNLELAREMAIHHPRVFLFDYGYNNGPCGKALRIYEPHWKNVLKELLP